MNVTLRQRSKAGRISLYLDYYSKGKRQYEYLKLYLIPEPENGKLTKEQRQNNQKVLALAEVIRSKRHMEIHSGKYGFIDKEKLNGSFIQYLDALKDRRDSSKGNYDNWDSMIKHLKKYVNGDISFGELDKDWLQGFKNYLEKEARTPAKKPLTPNSQSAYFSKLKAALKQAVKDGILHNNLADEVDGIKTEETERSFVTYDELKSLAKTDCDFPLLKQAFLFSALTGLRWSDIEKLTWQEVEYSNELGYYLRFRQKKTKGAETLPISEQAFRLLGQRGDLAERVFEGLKYSAWYNLKLAQWALKAGITKHFTFHTARHSFATLQLTLGTDIYTVSKMLGHQNLKTTQVYAKVIDQKKQEAANKINLEL